ncbi:MAG: NAD(P)/FAD-dependent oxidoreductase [Glaciecola sp.]
MKQIVVLGGGASGLELVSKLSRQFRHNKQVALTLIDRHRTHLWKPLLHEVAAGIIDKISDGVDYRMHAVRFGYAFQQGVFTSIDTQEKTITIEGVKDAEGRVIAAPQTISYDILIISVGSKSNDFGIPGVAEHSYFLDSLPQAEKFHNALLNQMLRLNEFVHPDHKLRISIVGAGATGTELAAVLYHAVELAKSYGMPKVTPERLEITLIEAGDRILPALPKRIADYARRALVKLQVTILENTRISQATKQGFVTADGELILSDLMVWAAGVKIPSYENQTRKFDTNLLNQIMVNSYLQVAKEEDIFAIGDCCGFLQKDGSFVPPRAQSAHQMADIVATNIHRKLKNEPLQEFVYKEYGSLLNLSTYSAIGSLMGNLTKNTMFIEGKLARLFYVSLYNMHQLSVHGWVKGILLLITKKISRIVNSKLKLH